MWGKLFFEEGELMRRCDASVPRLERYRSVIVIG